MAQRNKMKKETKNKGYGRPRLKAGERTVNLGFRLPESYRDAFVRLAHIKHGMGYSERLQILIRRDLAKHGVLPKGK